MNVAYLKFCLKCHSYESYDYAKICGVSDIGYKMFGLYETVLSKTRSVLILSTALLDTIYF